ncbi:hypothetical protein LguiA_025421 [Lonicera macranthoides]
MAGGPTGLAEANRGSRNDESRRLNFAFDAGLLPGGHPPDTPNADYDDEDDSVTRQSCDSEESSDSVGESKWSGDLAASFRVISESMLRTELAEQEMIKAREVSRLDAEKSRMESETELTRMLLQTQLQIASFMAQTSPNRKRKRSGSDEDDSLSFQR